MELHRNECNFVVGTVPADDPAPLGARPSEGKGMTKYGSGTYIRVAVVTRSVVRIFEKLDWHLNG